MARGQNRIAETRQNLQKDEVIASEKEPGDWAVAFGVVVPFLIQLLPQKRNFFLERLWPPREAIEKIDSRATLLSASC
jgi:hypothetical protein